MTKNEKFIKKSMNVHGNKYNYILVNYINNISKVVIICPTHGEFTQSPSKHMSGQGCPECGKLKISSSRSDNLESFIFKASNTHNNFYKYDKINYVNSKTKVVITCPEHGDFEQTPSGHISGKGCPKCRYIKSPSYIAKKLEKFLKEAKELHGEKYDYFKVNYKDSKTKVIIVCPIHGEFEQTPLDHLRTKGCIKCSNLARLTTQDFINRANEIHNYTYDYSKTNYVNMNKPVTIICPVHGEFEQSPRNHLKSSCGCPSCSLNGFNKNKPAILYYLKITTNSNKVLYKIGITNRSVKERFNLTDLSKIEIIKQKEYKNGQDAYDKEQEILKRYKKFKYSGKDVLSNGNTEIFTIDILNCGT